MFERLRSARHGVPTALTVEIWSTYAHVRRHVHRTPLPQLVAELGREPEQPSAPAAADRLSAAVVRALSLGPRRPTCLVCALVLYRMLRRRGERPELVVGLPPAAKNHDAHAWVELHGIDVGPAPGRNGHVALARFG